MGETERMEGALLGALAGPMVVATVASVDGGRVGVKSDAFGTASARVAIPHYRPRSGDAVLVASASDGARFVIGVLRALREVPDALVADDGASAAIEADDDGQVLRVRDGSGRLVFEHRPGRSVVHAPEGDLELATEGRLKLSGAQGVHVEGGEELRLGAKRTRLDAEELRVGAERARAELKEGQLVVGTLRTVAQRVRTRAEVVERTAGRVVEKAREVYRDTEGVEQTRAGRLRMVAEAAFSVLSEQATVKARDAVKIKGDKIYLA